MIVYHGDLHGDITPIYNYVSARKQNNLEVPETIVVLGDAGLNYFLDGRDRKVKRKLNKLGVNIFCIHGNHEARPQTIPTYHQEIFKNGPVYIEDEYPNLKFAVDGEIYLLGNHKTLVIGGAYSVDKNYRLANGYKWFSDEQPDEETKRKVVKTLQDNYWTVNQILSHTCPASLVPTEAFSPGVDQSTVDTSTEDFLEIVKEDTYYWRWLCGHWHIDKQVDNFYFLFNNFME